MHTLAELVAARRQEEQMQSFDTRLHPPRLRFSSRRCPHCGGPMALCNERDACAACVRNNWSLRKALSST